MNHLFDREVGDGRLYVDKLCRTIIQYVRPLPACLIGLTMSFLPADAADPWPNTAANRWQALALIETLNADILGSRSATLTLEAWCGTHHLAETQQVVADLIADAPARPPTAEQRQRLAVGADDPVAYRRVRLRCGNRILSEADNWYVPARLTPEMNLALTTTDAPFGKVVRPLQP